jgi:hypothetical protein
MNIDLIPLFPALEKAAREGPGKHELVRIFNAYQRRVPTAERFWTFVDAYGKVWARPKDVEAITLAVLPPVAACQQQSTKSLAAS